MDDKRDLEYQAGQEEAEQGGAKKEKPDQAQGKDDEGDATQQQGAKDEPGEAQEEDAAEQQGGEEGPSNEDSEDRYEPRQWAAPEVHFFSKKLGPSCAVRSRDSTAALYMASCR